jgi:hypothetical protein
LHDFIFKTSDNPTEGENGIVFSRFSGTGKLTTQRNYEQAFRFTDANKEGC